MLKVLAFLALPALIVFVMIKLLGDKLLKEGSRNKTILFFVLCMLIYIVLTALIFAV